MHKPLGILKVTHLKRCIFIFFHRIIVVFDTNIAQLHVERIRGIPIAGEVSIFTRSPNSAFTYEDITIQPAVGAEHYATTRDTIRMDIGEVRLHIPLAVVLYALLV